jgi:hypothetical protein
MIIKNIKLAVEMNRVIVSRHAKEEAEADNLTLEEILN